MDLSPVLQGRVFKVVMENVVYPYSRLREYEIINFSEQYWWLMCAAYSRETWAWLCMDHLWRVICRKLLSLTGIMKAGDQSVFSPYK